jgi:hypothetical protein
MPNNWLTEEITFKRYEVGGAAVLLVMLGLYMVHRQGQQSFDAGCAVGFGMGARRASAVLQRQGANAAQSQTPAQPQSGDGAQPAPFVWGWPNNPGMGALVSYDPASSPWLRQMM